MLLMELSTRHRLRVNGNMWKIDDHQLILHVLESYPNCPKYIHKIHSKEDTHDQTNPEGRDGFSDF